MPSKIVIDGNSWHCKLYNLTWENDPENLCQYVRGIFTSLLLQTLKVLTVLSLAVAGLALFGIAGFTLYEVLIAEGWGFVIKSLLVISALVATTFIIWGIVAVCLNRREISDFAKEKIKKRKTLSLLYEYLKAKKEKYCPLVEIDYTKKTKQA